MRTTKSILILVSYALIAAGVIGSVWAALASVTDLFGIAIVGATVVAVGVVILRATPTITLLNHAALLRKGAQGTGRVLSVRNSGTILDGENLVVLLRLEVTVADRPPYPATVRHVLHGRSSWDSLQPGMVLPVRVDLAYPHNVAVA